MPVVNPGIRRLLASAIQRLFNGASFSAPLTHSAIPTRAAPGTTATFTRATTATVKDHEGVLRTAIAGEARFEGARRVRNLLATTSENLSNAAWLKLSGGGPAAPSVDAAPISGPNNDLNGYVVTFPAVSGGGKYSLLGMPTFTSIAGNKYIPSVYLRNRSGASTIFIYGYWGAYSHITSVNITTEWTRVSLTAAAIVASTTGNFYIGCDTNHASMSAGIAAQTIDVAMAQAEDITGRADQTTPSEYVSVGVASSPYYHGSMVDGVKCFATDINGAAIPSTTLLGYLAEGARTNLCLQSNAFTTTWLAIGTPAATQNATGLDGGTTAWTLTDNDGAASEEIYQSIVLSAAAHTFSVFVKKTVGAQSSYPCLLFSPVVGAVNFSAVTIDTTNGIATAWTAYTGRTMASGISTSCVSYNDDFWRVSLTATATAEAWYVEIFPAGTTNATQSTGVIDTAATGSAVFYGAQVELGSFASSYIATTTEAVTRNLDLDSVPTASNIAAAASTVYLEFTPSHTPSGTIALWGTYVDASNYTAILHDATNLIFRKRIAGVNYDATIANAFVSGTTYKVCATWGTAGTSITLNGTEGTPHANTTAAQIAATMQWGADGNSLQQPFASIRNCRDWLRQLSASERTAVTA